jgi:Flp pilus assembly pilin Flp
MSAASDPKSRRRAGPSVGQAIVEYALILAIVAAIVIGALVITGKQTSSVISDVGTQIESVAGSDQPEPSAQAESTTPPSAYTKKKTCKAAGYTWIKKNKKRGIVAHCE